MEDTSTNQIIYLDYNATTYIHEEVAKDMQPYLSTLFGNPSSSHIFGVKTKQAVHKARQQVSTMLGCSPSEVIFTSGGSESNNYSIKGVAYHYMHNHPGEQFEIVTSIIEHPSVLEVFKYLEKTYKNIITVKYLPVNNEGIINMTEAKKLITNKCIFISIMHANNETGSLQPISEISSYAKSINPNIIMHTDASQSVGKVPVNVNDLKVDLLTICSHKFYGPKGIGALYIKQGIEKRMEKIIHGANHESNLRAGTENVLEIVGIGSACELVSKELKNRIKHFKKTRNILYKALIENNPNIILHGPSINVDDDLDKEEQRLSNTLYISFPNIKANLILDLLSDKIACSSGAACHSDEVKMSYVLSAMNVQPEVAMGTLRISTGLRLTETDAELSAKYINNVVNDLYSNNNNNNINTVQCRLTKNTHGMGCGCKLSPKLLNNILNSLPKMKCIETNPNIIVSNSTNDDACVYSLSQIETNKTNLISTIDFLTPICDNPFDYGEITCANALSDIYAMGGEPINALSIVAFPIERLSLDILKQILTGVLTKADEANCPILGGHSIEDNEPKIGLSVNGICNVDHVWKNSTPEIDDVIILTKPIGVGVIMTGVKRDYVHESKDKCVKDAIDSMKMLNKYHVSVIKEIETQKGKVVNACTDVTGFGLVGHLVECIANSKELSIEIELSKVKFFDKSKEMVEMNIYSNAAENNLNYYSNKCKYSEDVARVEKILMNDPQTSGGLVLFVNKEKVDDVVKEFEDKKLQDWVIGRTVKNEIEGESIVKVIK